MRALYQQAVCRVSRTRYIVVIVVYNNLVVVVARELSLLYIYMYIIKYTHTQTAMHSYYYHHWNRTRGGAIIIIIIITVSIAHKNALILLCILNTLKAREKERVVKLREIEQCLFVCVCDDGDVDDYVFYMVVFCWPHHYSMCVYNFVQFTVHFHSFACP